MNTDFMRTVAELAIEENRLLEIKYQTPDETTTRLVETLEIDDTNQNMKTWCRTRGEFRTFKFERVEEVKVTDQHFRPPHTDTEV